MTRLNILVWPAHPPDAKAETFVLVNKLVASVTVIDHRGNLCEVDKVCDLIFQVLLPGLLEHFPELPTLEVPALIKQPPWILDTPLLAPGIRQCPDLGEWNICQLRDPLPTNFSK